mgnify:FL=1
MLQALGEMMRHERIPRLPVYVNSPMATAALDVYRAAATELRADVDPRSAFDVGDLREVRTADESRALTQGRHGPAIIISSSGMATGGRVLHHLERMLPDPRNAVVLTGYQAVGTRGRQLAEGATRLKIHGQYVVVRAEVVMDDEFSVHADASDLVSWVGDLRPRPRLVFCTHGERSSAEALGARLEKELRVDAVAPRLDEVVTIDAGRLDTALPTVLPAPATSPNLTVAIVGRTYAAAHLEADLRRVAGAGDDLVLTGTITLRLTPQG